MSKKIKNGAVSDSVSKSTSTSNKKVVSQEILPDDMSESSEQMAGEGSEPVKCIMHEGFNPFTEKTVTEMVELTPERIEAQKKFISDFLKAYQRHPECAAAVMWDCICDVRTDVKLDIAQQDMTDEQIYRDAQDLIDCGMMLIKNYHKYHDVVNEKVKETLHRHIPQLLREIENTKEMIKKAREE